MTHEPIQTKEGVWVLSNDTHLSKWIAEHGRLDFDTHFLKEICQFIKGGDVVIDVGAFVGDHTLAYANMTSGRPGAVWAFEPNPIVYECLKKNMAPYSHVYCVRAGVSDKESMTKLQTDPNLGGAHLIELPEGDIITVTIDSLNLDRCALIKIDAEGFEARVLIGAKKTLSRCRPVLVIEINEGALQRQGWSGERLTELITNLGYRITGAHLGLQYDVICHPV